MKTYIEIDRIQLHARHGVMPQETRVGNLFEVTLRVCFDFETAAAGDDIDATLNYAEAIDIVRDVMAVPRRLLETVAVEIRDRLLARWPDITGGYIKVTKLRPPVTTPVAGCSAIVEWSEA